MSAPHPRCWLPVILVLSFAAAAAGEMRPAVPVTDNVQRSDCRIWAKRFDPFRIEWRVEGDAEAAGQRSVRCVTSVADGDRGRKGAKVSLSAELVDSAGKVVSLGARTAKTDRECVGAIEFPIVGVAAGQGFTVRVEGRYASWKKATIVITDCGPS